MWERLLGLLERTDIHLWAIWFEGAARITLEHFPEEYIGDKEEGTGDWSHEGTIEQCMNEAEKFIYSFR